MILRAQDSDLIAVEKTIHKRKQESKQTLGLSSDKQHFRSNLYNMEKFESSNNNSSTETPSHQIRKRPNKLVKNKISTSTTSIAASEKNFRWERQRPVSMDSEPDVNNYLKIEKNRRRLSPKIITLDSIKMTDRLVNLCYAVDYIANIMKAKAQLDEVNKRNFFYFFC